MSRLKATGNKNTHKPAKVIKEGRVTYKFYKDEVGKLYCPQIRLGELLKARKKSEKEWPIKTTELRLIESIANHPHLWREYKLEHQRADELHEEVSRDAIKLAQRKKLKAEDAFAAALYKIGCTLLSRMGPMHNMGQYLEQLSEPVAVAEPPQKKGGLKPGGHKTEKALLRPKWVNVSQAARVLGLQRSTILKWHAAGRVVLPVGGHTRTYRLHRGALGQVNLTLLQHIAQHKRSLPGPGRRLGNAPGRELVAAAVRAHGSQAQAAEYSRVCKALSLLEGVKQGPLLHAARRHLNRLILRNKSC